MATSPDHPGLPYLQAKGYSPGRPDGPPLWIVVHDMEASELPDRAERTAAYFADPPDGRQVSAHYCWDDTSGVQCVRTADRAWTVGNRPGNNQGINHEFAGFANQTRAGWLDTYGLAMFGQAAPIIRADAAQFRIPLTRRAIAELRAYKPGLTSHNDLRVAFGGTTHTDPGPGFPWDTFLTILEGDVQLTDRVPLPHQQYPEVNGQQTASVAGALGYTLARTARLEHDLTELLAEAVADRTRDAVALAAIKALAAAGGVDAAPIVAAVREEAGRTRALMVAAVREEAGRTRALVVDQAAEIARLRAALAAAAHAQAQALDDGEAGQPGGQDTRP